MRIDEARHRDHFPIFTGKPHLHCALGTPHFHADQPFATDAHIHVGNRHRGPLGTVPLLKLCRLCPQPPDKINGGVEMAFGVLRDPVFGPVAMVGLGGVFIEILKDVAFRRCPFDPAQAEAMIRSLKGFPLLDGARGKPKADVKALAESLAALSRFAVAAGPRLASVDVNPMLVLPAGQGAFAADAVIEIEEGH